MSAKRETQLDAERQAKLPKTQRPELLGSSLGLVRAYERPDQASLKLTLRRR
jgi:hypothetical protein